MNKKEQTKPEETKQEMEEKAPVVEQTPDQEIDYKDKYFRLLADIENIRKNSAKQISNAYTMANEKLLKEMLPYIDALDLAINNVKDTTNQETLESGLVCLKKQLTDILAKFGFQEIKINVGDKFNVDIMDAIMIMPTEKEEDHDKVYDIMNKGYTLNGNIIRHANVIVYG